MSSSILFRSTLRSLRTVRPLPRAIRPLPAFTAIRPVGPVFAQRNYASGSLGKDEVEKRIIEILKGFDKVTDPTKVDKIAMRS